MSGILFFIFASCHPLSYIYMMQTQLSIEYNCFGNFPGNILHYSVAINIMVYFHDLYRHRCLLSIAVCNNIYNLEAIKTMLHLHDLNTAHHVNVTRSYQTFGQNWVFCWFGNFRQKLAIKDLVQVWINIFYDRNKNSKNNKKKKQTNELWTPNTISCKMIKM